MPKILGALLEERDAKSGELQKLTEGLEARVAAWRDESEDTRGTEPAHTDDEEVSLKTLTTEIREVDDRIKEEKEAEETRKLISEARALVVPVEERSNIESVKEPMVYGPDSPNSYIADFVRWHGGTQWRDHDGAGKRMAQWSHQNEREIALDERSDKGRAALTQLREQYRELNPTLAAAALTEARERGRASLEDKEQRTGIGTGGGATASAGGGGGAAFVTPVFDVKDYAPYREYGRAFADACYKRPLPPYGMEVYIPQVTSGAEVAKQTESGQVAEKIVGAGYLSGGLETIAGQAIVSQQLIDRSGPDFSFDEMIFDQLERNYANVFDTYVLNKALATATQQSWSGESGAFILVAKEAAGGFYGQVAKAKKSVRTTKGTVLKPTHLFTTASRWDYMTAFADPNGRLQVVPNYAGPYNAVAAGGDGDNGIEGATGVKLQGLPVYNDENIPTNGTTGQDQAIVGCLDEVWVYEGPKTPRVIPQTLAQNLQVLLDLYSYATAIVRYPAAVVAINGTAMKEPAYTH